MTSEKVERTDAEVATAIRETVRGLNELFGEAAHRGLDIATREVVVGEIGVHPDRKYVEVAIQKVVNL